MDFLLSAVLGVVSSAILGGVKTLTTKADVAIAPILKPIQPVFVTGLALALPLLSNALHLTAIPDAQVIAAAPVAGLIGVVAREVAVRVFKAPPGPAPNVRR